MFSARNPSAGAYFPPMIGSPSVILPRSLLLDEGTSIAKLLYFVGFEKSVAQGRKTVRGKGAYLGVINEEGKLEFINQDQKKPAADPAVNGGTEQEAIWQRYIINDDTIVLRRGKASIKTVKLVSDTEFVSSTEYDFLGSSSWWSDICPPLLRGLQGNRGFDRRRAEQDDDDQLEGAEDVRDQLGSVVVETK